MHSGLKTVSLQNGAGQTEWLHVKEFKQIHTYHFTHTHTKQPQIDQRSQHKTDTLNLTEEQVEHSLELTGTEKVFEQTLLAQALRRSTINKWDLMKLRSFCIAKDTIFDKAAAYRIGKAFYQLHI